MARAVARPRIFLYRSFLLLGVAWVLFGCGTSEVSLRLTPPPATPSSPLSSPTHSPTPTIPPTATVTSTPLPSAPLPSGPLPSATSTITPTPEPYGCWQPPEDYSRVEVNGWVLNQRTLAMLQHAAELYGGELEITGYHITQGSYTINEPASFGTHDGGGAVDLSVMRRGTYTVLWDDIERLVQALRVSGFAAWLRTYGELHPDSPYHIHAIAIGDQDLSPAAQEQLTGPFGYFRGFTGVPIPSGVAEPDRHGGPVLCQWMIEKGYRDLRGDP